MKKTIIIIFSSIIFFYLLMPKEKLYYTLEEFINKNYKTIISNETINSSIFNISITNGVIYSNDINLANFEKIEINPFLFKNSLTIDNIKLDSTFQKMFPTEIERVILDYSIMDIENIKVKVLGKFGSANGYINLKSSKVSIFIENRIDLKKYNTFYKMLKIKDNGFIYESKF